MSFLDSVNRKVSENREMIINSAAGVLPLTVLVNPAIGQVVAASVMCTNGYTAGRGHYINRDGHQAIKDLWKGKGAEVLALGLGFALIARLPIPFANSAIDATKFLRAAAVTTMGVGAVSWIAGKRGHSIEAKAIKYGILGLAAGMLLARFQFPVIRGLFS